GAPVGRLPYADGSFDIVYTSEVLIHVRPEHLSGILAELLRVAKWQVLHFEPAEHTPISTDSHDGCWRHDLPAAYSALGVTCETLPSGFRLQAPYRVMLGGPPPFTWSPVLLDMYRRLDRDIDAGFDELRERLGAQTHLATTLDARLADANREALRSQEAYKALQARLAAGEAAAREEAAKVVAREEAVMAAAREEAAKTFVREMSALHVEHAAKLAEAAATASGALLAREKAETALAALRQELAEASQISGQSIERANSLAHEVQRLNAERRATIQELHRLLSK
ncbi:MAG: class I SAM-dependent methyltransferase, partial [Phycisphaerales bacterium]